ncbi:MAG: hypothetical protein ABIK97_01005 [candidate division WOR-3 bacterium]
MKKLIIKGFAFLGVIEKKGFLSYWVLIPTLIFNYGKRDLRRYYRVIKT